MECFLLLVLPVNNFYTTDTKAGFNFSHDISARFCKAGWGKGGCSLAPCREDPRQEEGLPKGSCLHSPAAAGGGTGQKLSVAQAGPAVGPAAAGAWRAASLLSLGATAGCVWMGCRAQENQKQAWAGWQQRSRGQFLGLSGPAQSEEMVGVSPAIPLC